MCGQTWRRWLKARVSVTLKPLTEKTRRCSNQGACKTCNPTRGISNSSWVLARSNCIIGGYMTRFNRKCYSHVPILVWLQQSLSVTPKRVMHFASSWVPWLLKCALHKNKDTYLYHADQLLTSDHRPENGQVVAAMRRQHFFKVENTCQHLQTAVIMHFILAWRLAQETSSWWCLLWRTSGKDRV